MASIAPGSIKLFGEHAVIYDRVGVSASFGRYATVHLQPNPAQRLDIALPDIGFHKAFTEEQVEEEYEAVDSAIKGKDEARLRAMRHENFALPFAYLLGSVLLREGFRPLKVEVRSEVPRRSGLGSSSSIFTALAKELSVHFKLKYDTQDVADLANLGDMVVHGSPSGIDVNTCSHGGILRFRRKEGAKRISAAVRVPVVVVNTNVAKDTGEMIAKVAKQLAKDRTGVDAIFDDMEEAAFAGIEALKAGDLIALGAEFDRAGKCFERLGLNTKETDEIISVARKHGAYGAKISGAGGGGCVLALAKEPAKLLPLFSKLGYPAFETVLGVDGVRHEEIE